MKIIIDVRERDLYNECIHVLNTSLNYPHITLVQEQLTLGDIIITNNNESHDVVIERKTFSDLMASIKDNRYKEQSHRLIHSSGVPLHSIFYLLEGGFHQLSTLKEQRIVYSAIASLQMFKGFSVFRTISLRESVEWILSLANKMHTNIDKKIVPYFMTSSYLDRQQTAQNIPSCNDAEEASHNNAVIINNLEAKNYVHMVKKVKKDNICRENIGEIMLSQIPGISSNTAICVLKHFESFTDMVYKINADPTILHGIMIETNGKKRRLGKNCIEIINNFLQL